jgi:hypothetical protein
MAAVGLIVTALNTILDDLFTDTQIMSFAAIVVGFLMRPKPVLKDGINPEAITDSVVRALRKVEEEKKKTANR